MNLSKLAHAGRLVIDAHSRQVRVDGKPVSLSPTEHRLLLYLVHNAGRVVTTGQIAEEVWGEELAPGQTGIKVYVHRLRSKVEPDPRHPRYIRSWRGRGYEWAVS